MPTTPARLPSSTIDASDDRGAKRTNRTGRSAALLTALVIVLTACVAPASKAIETDPTDPTPTVEPNVIPSTDPTVAPTDPVDPTVAPDPTTDPTSDLSVPPSTDPTGSDADVEWTGKRPNIVTIMADDMRVDDLLFSPNVRRLIGKDGLTFNNSFSPYPLCCPARASFLTGLYAHNHGVYWHHRPWGYGAFDDSKTLASSLSKVGYRTAFVGKYLNGYGPMKSKVTGQRSYRYVPNGWDDWYGAFEDPRVGNYHGGTYNYFDTPYNINGRPTNNRRGEYQTNTLGTFARKIVTDNSKKKAPFFMYLSFTAPHFGGTGEADDPRPGRDFLRKDGTRSDFSTPARPNWVKGKFDRVITRAPGVPKKGGPAEKDVSDKPQKLRRLKELSPKGRKALAEVTRQRAEAIYVMDREIGRLVRTLKKRGEWDNTVIMFTSDNGYFLGEHRQRVGKVKAHEPSLRVPFLITGPGMRGGHTRNDPITTVDLSATILDIAGATPPHLADGQSRLATLLTGDQGWTIPVVTEATHTTKGKRTDKAFTDARTSVGLRTPRYSYTRYDNGEGELYDLYVDPAQMENVYDNASYKTVRNALARMWPRYKDCAAATCHEPLPADLSATPDELARLTDHYWTVIDRRYGW
jgi:N-acetylglucosamine-6-sulfatase